MESRSEREELKQLTVYHRLRQTDCLAGPEIEHRKWERMRFWAQIPAPLGYNTLGKKKSISKKVGGYANHWQKATSIGRLPRTQSAHEAFTILIYSYPFKNISPSLSYLGLQPVCPIPCMCNLLFFLCYIYHHQSYADIAPACVLSLTLVAPQDRNFTFCSLLSPAP